MPGSYLSTKGIIFTSMNTKRTIPWPELSPIMRPLDTLMQTHLENVILEKAVGQIMYYSAFFCNVCLWQQKTN